MQCENGWNLSKQKKPFQYCDNDLLSSCKVFLFIMSDSKLVQIAFIDAASYLPPPFYLLWCHSVGKKSCCCCICSFPSHFTQIRAHRRRDLLAIFWVFMKTLPHFQSAKKRPLICVSWRLLIRISHNPKWKQKARPLPKNVINISYCMQHRRMKWGSSRMWDRVGRGSEVFSHSDLHRWRNIINM